MTLPASGPISFNNINVELGVAGTTTASLGQTSYRTLAGVPSGAISMSNFYGKSNRGSASYTFTGSTANASINVTALSGYIAGNTTITITVNSGVYLYSTGTGTPGLTLTGGSGADTLTLINNGIIMGMGGVGGTVYGNGTDVTSVTAGEAGGNALSIGFSLTIQNNGAIVGGGGGGGGAYGLVVFSESGGGGGAGGGTGGSTYINSSIVNYGGGGGGLGGGGGNGAANAGGTSGSASGGGGGRIVPGSSVQTTVGGLYSIGGGANTAGTAVVSGAYGGGLAAGLGGQAGASGGVCNVKSASEYEPSYQTCGGGGGGWGASGASGARNTVEAIGGVSSGGAGGKCVALNGYTITWSATGTRYGAIS